MLHCDAGRLALFALGRQPERPAQFNGIEALPKRVQVLPADVALVKTYIAQHCD